MTGTVKQFVNWLVDTGKVLVWAGVIALAFRSFLFEPFSIPTGSMYPTLMVGDYLFVNKFSYGYGRHSFPLSFPPFDGRIMDRPVERGEVVVFYYPEEAHKKDYIKRFIGMPGDRIQVKEGVIHINGEPIKREQINDYFWKTEDGEIKRMHQFQETLPNGKTYRVIQDPMRKFYPYPLVAGKKNFDNNNTDEYIVPEGYYFAMGDNRDHSSDSRYQGRPRDIGFINKQRIIGRASFKWLSLDNAGFFQIWKWPTALRYDRIFTPIR
jgi:signal peptidase I